MNTAIRIIDDFGMRSFAQHDLPLEVGGINADIRLQGVQHSVASIGIEQGVPFIDSPGSIRINGSVHDRAAWLTDGDVAVLPEGHLVCHVQSGSLVIHARSRASAQTEPPRVDEEHAHQQLEPVAFHPGRGAMAGPVGGARWALLGVAGSAVILGLLAWFMFTARSVEVAIAPEPDRISIRGALVAPKVGGRFLLRPGRYQVLAIRPGYHDLQHPIEVGPASSQQFTLQMEKLPGLLDLSTSSVDGAQVFIDGEEIGVTPVVAAEVPAGLHSLKVIARNHLPYIEEIEIIGMGEMQRREIALQPNWAPVSLASDPPGASVRIGDLVLGETPLTAEIEAGEQTLELELAGFQPVQKTIAVVPGVPVELESIKLEPADGVIALTTSPPGATVTVDGQFAGRSPARIPVSPGAQHTVRVVSPGHAPATRTVELAPGQLQALQVDLQPILGSVRINARPDDAELIVDGVSRGRVNQVLSLTTAPHTIEVRKPGYAPHVETLTPRRDAEQRLNIVLRTIAEAQAAVLDPVITTVAGQTMRLMPTGSLQMGSPRREQGRRSNEARRDVELTREFYLSENEVTNRQYREFMSTHNSGFLGGLSLEGEEQPVVRVSWQQAARYCNWLSEREGLPKAYVERDGRLVARRPMTTGYRLPTEAEWAWVARYAGQPRPTRYPWGDTLPPPAGRANLADNAARNFVAQSIANYDDGFSVTAPVGSFAPNTLGLRDLDGNVAEWMNDYYEASSNDPFVTQVDPLGPEQGNRYVIRGASWKHGAITELRSAYRDYGAGGREDLGFRLARYAR